MLLDEAIRLLRIVPDFPAKGVNFIDISPLLGNAEAFSACIDALASAIPDVETIAAVEARGFVIGAALAIRLGSGFVPIRKRGKLPYGSMVAEYATEYSTDTLEMQADALAPGARVAIVDDVLATGGTSEAALSLAVRCGCEPVALAYLVEIPALRGRSRLAGRNVTALVRYDGGKLQMA